MASAERSARHDKRLNEQSGSTASKARSVRATPALGFDQVHVQLGHGDVPRGQLVVGVRRRAAGRNSVVRSTISHGDPDAMASEA